MTILYERARWSRVPVILESLIDHLRTVTAKANLSYRLLLDSRFYSSIQSALKLTDFGWIPLAHVAVPARGSVAHTINRSRSAVTVALRGYHLVHHSLSPSSYPIRILKICHG